VLAVTGGLGLAVQLIEAKEICDLRVTRVWCDMDQFVGGGSTRQGSAVPVVHQHWICKPIF